MGTDAGGADTAAGENALRVAATSSATTIIWTWLDNMGRLVGPDESYRLLQATVPIVQLDDS